MPRYRPQKLEEIGLQAYLDQTKSIHNNKGYDKFTELHELDAPFTIIARAFKVEWRTAKRWVALYEQQAENKHEREENLL